MLALVAGAAAAGSAPNTSRTAVGEIAFSVQHGDNDAPWDIYVVRTDGRWILRKNTRLNETDPVWAPDGRHIAFDQWPVGTPGYVDVWVYTMNPDGTHRRRLVPGMTPQWSPDGRQIAYVNNGIYVMNADGTRKKRLTRSGGSCEGSCDTNPRWSPDGKQIAFTGTDVYIVNASDGRERRLTRTGGIASEWWAPGRKIIFTRTSGGMYIVKADGTGLRKVTSAGGLRASGGGGWSPDAQLIVYALDGISTVRPRDGSVRRLTRGPDGGPTWGPSGRQIAFVRSPYSATPGPGIWIVNRDGSKAHRIAAVNGDDAYYTPTWAAR